MKIWTTRDGEEIPYNKLNLSHIYNIINYARTSGFYTVSVSHSIVDNTDDVPISKDCSLEVIKEMKEELLNRNIINVYYVEHNYDKYKWRRTSPIFESKEKACVWFDYHHYPHNREYRITKEYMH